MSKIKFKIIDGSPEYSGGYITWRDGKEMSFDTDQVLFIGDKILYKEYTTSVQYKSYNIETKEYFYNCKDVYTNK